MVLSILHERESEPMNTMRSELRNQQRGVCHCFQDKTRPASWSSRPCNKAGVPSHVLLGTVHRFCIRLGRVPIPIRDAMARKSFLPKLFGARLFFLSPRRRSGERTEERGIFTKRPSSPRPSPPSDGGEGVFLIPVVDVDGPVLDINI